MGNTTTSLQELPQITNRRFQKLQKQLTSNVKGTMFVNSECKILYINNAIKNLFQVKEKKLLGNAFEILCPRSQPHLNTESKYLIYSTSELAISRPNEIIDLVWVFKTISDLGKKSDKNKKLKNTKKQLIWANVGILAFHIKKKLVFQIWVKTIRSPETILEFGDKIKSLEETIKVLKKDISEKQKQFGTLETEKKMSKLTKEIKELTNEMEENRYQIKLKEQSIEMYKEKQENRKKDPELKKQQIQNYLQMCEKKQKFLNQEFEITKKKNEMNPLLASLKKFQNEIQQNIEEKNKVLNQIQKSKDQINDMGNQIERIINDRKNLIFQSPGIIESNSQLLQIEEKIKAIQTKIKRIKLKIQNYSQSKTIESVFIEKKRLLKMIINENNQMKLKLNQIRSFKTLSLKTLSEDSVEDISDTLSESSSRDYSSPKTNIKSYLSKERNKPKLIKPKIKTIKKKPKIEIKKNYKMVKKGQIPTHDDKDENKQLEKEEMNSLNNKNEKPKKLNKKSKNKSVHFLSKRTTDKWIEQLSRTKTDKEQPATPTLRKAQLHPINSSLKSHGRSFSYTETSKSKILTQETKNESDTKNQTEKTPLFPIEKLKNFDIFITLPLPTQFFNEYLTDVSAQEMLIFYKDYQVLQEKYTLQNSKKISKYIIDNYISIGSIFEVNFEGCNQDILQRYKSGDYSFDLFDPIGKRVYKILKDEYFETFKLTSYFTDLRELNINLQNKFENNSYRTGTLISEKNDISVLNRNLIFHGEILDECVIIQNISEKLIDLLNLNSNLNIINDGDDTNIDCESLSKTLYFTKFEMICTSLQAIKLGELCRLNNLKRKIFFINLYNLMAIHGLLTRKHPKDIHSIKKFQKRCTYDIGGKLFNLDDILQILKIKNLDKNSSSIIQDLSITTVDTRIIFALFSFASQPIPLQTYYPKSLNRQLTIVTRWHLEKYVKVNHEDEIIILPQIFYLNWKHFGINTSQLIFWIRNFLSFSDPMGLYLYKIKIDKLIVRPNLNFSSAYSLLEQI
ncbi:electron carrier/ protein disulfide oxidoreductase [Anaeramoeba flamelloides]|uniref:Electron carrier/ protein disulfide oxidoreductase n=1 Tax=Anaeramoeba flamelloides TaxID=1746091 RepID=A0AAV7Y5G3_9EUKA|nr:electron carrier/ protein disulfide oxidoreductase [Anaeramoeba flamelloides]